jgi:SAM-dependent methyltransferase
MMNVLISKIFKEEVLILAVLSKPSSKEQEEKISIVPLQIKGKKVFQFTIQAQNKALHSNYSPSEAETALTNYLEKFKEIHFYTTEEDILALKQKDGTWKLISSKPSKKPQVKTHNRLKHYILDESSEREFWEALGIANKQGKIKPDKQAKFRQVNRFIEIISDVLPSLPTDQPLTILDFGCGKAYLTFALYHYLAVKLNRSVHMIGIDLKKDVVDHLEAIRKKFHYTSLQFFEGDIKTYPLPENIDLVVSLHACDTATDHVIARSIKASAKVILSVPCCQHAFYSKIKQPILKPLLKHGILKERFAALATDAARAEFLELSGYSTQVIEFIDTEHTPKNILIKAIKSSKPPLTESKTEYKNFLLHLNLPDFLSTL